MVTADESALEKGTVSYIFALFFLLVSLFYYTLISSNVFALVLTRVLSRFVIPSDALLRIGSLGFSPLRCRLMIKDVYYFNSNMGLKITDAYITFKYWGRLLREEGWRTPGEMELLRAGNKVRATNPLTGKAARGSVTSDAKPGEDVKVTFNEENVHMIARKNLRVEDFTGRLHVHVNGVELTIYNNTNKYDALRKMASGEDAAPVAEEIITTTLDKGKPRQPSTFENVMSFIRRVEIDVRTCSLSFGSPHPSTPYFVHLSFSHLIGSYFITNGKFMADDLYRNVIDLNLLKIGLQCVPTKEVIAAEASLANSSGDTVMIDRISNFRRNVRDAAKLVYHGDESHPAEVSSTIEVTDVFTTILDRRENPAMHIVYYFDTPGVERDDAVVRPHCDLAKSGVEIEIDAKKVCYGPFSSLVIGQVIGHLSPADYKPWPLYTAKRGALRPFGLFELRVDFVCDLLFVIPFRHKKISPVLPYGLEDSGNTGTMQIHVGKGSQVRMQNPSIMHASQKNVLNELFISLEHAKVFTSFNNSYSLMADRVDIFLDNLYGQKMDEKSFHDTIVVLNNADFWYTSDLLAYIWDLIADFGYARTMYFGEPLEKYFKDTYHFSEFVPSLTTYEIFFEGTGRLYLNANPHNVCYAKDHCNKAEQHFVIINFRSAHVIVTISGDHYCIFRENEYVTDFSVSFEQADWELSLPTTHTADKDTFPFLQAQVLKVRGYYSSFYPDMSLPMELQDKSLHQTNTTIGLAVHYNTCLIVLDASEVHSRLRMHHISALTSAVYNNLFTVERNFCTPEEFARFQSGGMNIKYGLVTYLCRNDFRWNDLDLTLEVNFKAVSIDLDLGPECNMRGTLRTAEIAYAMHFSSLISEGHLVSSPIVITFSTQEGETNDYLVIQGLEWWKNGFYGPSPLYLLYHVNSRVVVQCFSCSLECNTVAFLAEFGQAFVKDSTDTRLDILLAENPPIRHEVIVPGKVEKSFSQFRKPSTDVEERNSVASSYAPFNDPSIYLPFLEAYAKKTDEVEEASRMCYRLTQGSLHEVRATIACDENTVCSVAASQGIHAAYSTLHDGNTDSRWTLKAPDIQVLFLISRQPEMVNTGDFIEVGSLHCALILRRSVCFGAGEGYVDEQHSKQRMFINNMRRLIDYDGIGDATSSSADSLRNRKKAMTFRKGRSPMDVTLTEIQPKVGPETEVESQTSFQSCDQTRQDFDENQDYTLNSESDSQSNDPDIDPQMNQSLPSLTRSMTVRLNQSSTFYNVSKLPLFNYHSFLDSFDRLVEGPTLNVICYARSAAKRKVGSSTVPRILFIRHRQRGQSVQRGNEDVNGNISWTRVSVDNERRSREKTSTYHWHLEFTQCLHIVTTPKLVNTLLNFVFNFDTAKSEFRSLSRSPSQGKSPSRASSQQPAPQPPPANSKVRDKMEWLYNYTTIMSLAAPEVQVRLVTCNPHSRDPDISKTPVFQSVLSIQRINAVHSNEEPARVNVNTKAKQMSASLSVEAVHFVVMCLTTRYNCMPDLPKDVVHSLENVLTTNAATAFVLSIQNVRVRGKHYKDMSEVSTGPCDRLPISFNISAIQSFLCRDSPEMLSSLMDHVTSLQREVTDYFLLDTNDKKQQFLQSNNTPPGSPRASPRKPFAQQRSSTSRIQPSNADASNCRPQLECIFVLGSVEVKYYPTSFFEFLPKYNVHSSSVISVRGMKLNCSTSKEGISNLSIVVDITRIYIRLYPTIVHAFAFYGVSNQKVDSMPKEEPQKSATPHYYIQISLGDFDFNIAATRYNYLQLRLTKSVASHVSQQTSLKQRTSVLEEGNERIDSTLCIDTITLRYAANLTFLGGPLSGFSGARSEPLSDHESDLKGISMTEETIVLQCTIRSLVVSHNNADVSKKVISASHVAWSSLLIEMPHRPNAVETVEPQYRELVQTWQDALKTLRRENVQATDDSSSPSGLLSLELAKTEFRVTLINGTVVGFTIPKLYVFAVAQDSVARMKLHISSPQLLSSGRSMHFPDVFVLQTHYFASKHSQCVLIIEKLETDITSEMFANAIVLYQKLSFDLVHYITSLKTEETNEPRTERGAAENPSFSETTIYFAGASLHIKSAQSDAHIEIEKVKVWVNLRDDRQQRLKWSATFPRIEVTLLDSEQTAPILSPLETSHHQNEDKKPRRGRWPSLGEEDAGLIRTEFSSGTFQNPPGRESSNPSATLHHSPSFMWVQMVTSVSAANFNDGDPEFGPSFMSPTTGEATSEFINPNSFLETIQSTTQPEEEHLTRRGSFALSHKVEEPTGQHAPQILAKKVAHVASDIPSLHVMLRSGAVEMFGRLVDEYQVEWLNHQSGIIQQNEELKIKLEKSRYFKFVVRRNVNKLQEVASVASSSVNTEEEFRWVTITSLVVRNISVVVPAGDNLYNRCATRSLVFDDKGDKSETIACLDKRYLVPTYAVKMSIDEVSLSISNEQLIDAENAQADSKVMSLEVHKLGFYINEGQKIENRQAMIQQLQQRKVLGGIGCFVESSSAEFSKSRNSFMFPLMTVKVKMMASEKSSTINVNGHIEGPCCRINPRSVIYLTDFAKDFTREKSNAPKEDTVAPKGDNVRKVVKKQTITLCIDVTSGEIIFHSWAPLPSGFANVKDTTGGAQRKVSFGLLKGAARKIGQESERSHTDSSSVISVASPALGLSMVIKQWGDTTDTTLNVDVVQPPIDIHPTSVILWQEYVLLDASWNADKLDRAQTLLQGLWIDDVGLLPLPRTFLSSALQWASDAPPAASLGHRRYLSGDKPLPLGPAQSQFLLNITIAPVRLSATCSPISQTSMSLAVEEQGAINVIFSSKTTQKVQSTNLVIGLKKIRFEVQARMEVKFLEFTIPEAILDIVPGTEVTSVICTVADAKKGFFELIVRLTHSSQLFMVLELWRQKGLEAQQSLQNYHSSTTVDSDLPKATSIVAFSFLCEIERLITKVELGPSSKHELTLNRVAVTAGHTPKGAVSERRRGKVIIAERNVSIFDLSFSEIGLHCEGHATGNVTFPSGLILRSSRVGPCTEDGFPTQQWYLVVPQMRAVLRELQVKDVLNVDINSFLLRLYDENIAGTVPQHHVFIDLSTEKTVIALSTEFVTVVCNISSEIDTTLGNEKEIAQAKLDSHRFYSANRVKRADTSVPNLNADLLASIPYLGNTMQIIPTGQIRLLIRGIQLTVGDLSHSSTGHDAAALQMTIASLTTEYAQCLDRNTVRKVLQLSLESWDIFRKSSEKRSAILGAKGINSFDLGVSQPLGNREVAYTFAFQCEKPWHGSPHAVDFEVINKTVGSFTKSTKAGGPTPKEKPPREAPSPSVETSDERIYKSKRSTGFAPELRLVSDVVINIDTVLGWVGIDKGAIPRLLYINVADSLEGLLYSAYHGTCPGPILEADKIAVADFITTVHTPSAHSTSMSPAVTPSDPSGVKEDPSRMSEMS